MKKESKNLKVEEVVQEGMLVTPASLMKKGVSRSLINNWRRSGQLVDAAHGVYRRPGPPLKWQAVVYSLQCMDEFDPVIGGLTALEMQGFGHYLNMSAKQTVHLYHRKRMPHWLAKIKTNAEFLSHPDTLLTGAKGLSSVEWHPEKGVIRNNDPMSGLKSEPWGNWDWPITLSTPERALLEVLDDLPQTVAFETADALMQGMVNLSPTRLERLLHNCSSIKVRRLFFWFAERQNHAWLKRLSAEQFDLGHGKRMLVKGGILDKKYQITVPQSLQSSATS